MKPLDKRLGYVIRATRERHGLRQDDLAARCGISRRHIAGIERGANFTVAVLVAIAGELPELAAVIGGFLALASVSVTPAERAGLSSL